MHWASYRVAIGFGAFLICAEVCLHVDPIRMLPGSFWQLPLHDWIAGGYLIYAGRLARRGDDAAPTHLVAAWAFNASLLCGAVFSHVEDLSSGAEPPNAESLAFVCAIVALFSMSLRGLVTAVRTQWVVSRESSR
jgi:hypothetical protein